MEDVSRVRAEEQESVGVVVFQSGGGMNVVVTGRHCTVSPELKELVRDRVMTVERLWDRVIRVEVEFSATDDTKNPSDAIEVQITLRSWRPVVRAETKTNDKTLALEQALDRLKVRLRKATDRCETHRGLRTTIFAEEPASVPVPKETESELEEPTYKIAGLMVNGDGPPVVCEEEFKTVPLNLAQALDEMELVGHDLFFYQDSATEKPSVVYHRKTYNYGIIYLNANVRTRQAPRSGLGIP